MWLAGVAFVVLSVTYATQADPSRRSRAALAYAALCVPSLYLMRAVWQRDDRGAVGAVVALAVVARVAMFAAPPLWSNDAYRYVWDGRLALRGIDPRSIRPDDSALAADRATALWSRIDLRTIPTVYPPGAILLFEAAARVDSDGIRGAKTIAVAGDALAFVALLLALRRMRLPRGRAAVYALHPLVLVSFAQDAHIEAFAVAGIVAAIAGGTPLRVAGLAAGILTKLYPAVLAPVVFTRDRIGALALAAIVALAFVPTFASGHPLGSLRSYLGDQRFNEALFPLIGPIGGALVLAVVVAAAAVAARRGARMPEASLAVVSTYLVVTPNVLPWYLTVLPALVATMREPFGGRGKPLVVALAAWTATVALAYAAPWYVAPGSRAEQAVHVVEFAPLLAGLAWWLGARR